MDRNLVINNEVELHENANELIEQLYIILDYIGSKRYKVGGISPEVEKSINEAEVLFAALKSYLFSTKI